MPFKSEKIIIEGSEFDKRVKLTDDDKELIRWLHEEEQLSQRQLAARFNVSRRTIQFVLDPDKLKQNQEKLAQRGGWKIYYDKEKHIESVKNHRRYKQELLKNGKIDFPKNEI